MSDGLAADRRAVVEHREWDVRRGPKIDCRARKSRSKRLCSQRADCLPIRPASRIDQASRIKCSLQEYDNRRGLCELIRDRREASFRSGSLVHGNSISTWKSGHSLGVVFRLFAGRPRELAVLSHLIRRLCCPPCASSGRWMPPKHRTGRLPSLSQWPNSSSVRLCRHGVQPSWCYFRLGGTPCRTCSHGHRWPDGQSSIQRQRAGYIPRSSANSDLRGQNAGCSGPEIIPTRWSINRDALISGDRMSRLGGRGGAVLPARGRIERAY